MNIMRKKYGEFDGNNVYAYTLDNKNGLQAEILNYGGTVTKMVFNGVDVVLGFDSFEEYLNNNYCFGATIGRNANRIKNSEFELNGKGYKLFPNDKEHNLHGGKNGFHTKLWNVSCFDSDEPSLVLERISSDGEEGFPGRVNVRVTFTLTADNGVCMHYEGKTDADTVINMTNHTYFNLNGHSAGSVDGHRLWLASSFYTPSTRCGVADGQILLSKGTPFDFSAETTIGDNLTVYHKQTDMFKGYDHNLVLDGKGYRLAGTLSGDKSGIVMEMYTDCPCVQLYVPNSFNSERKYKDGANYTKHNAVCLETQQFPNSVNFPHFPRSIVKKGEKYDTTTTYKFR